MTPQLTSGAGELGNEKVITEHDDFFSDEENDTTHDIEGPSVSRTACDRCRRRKIKCDRRNPCDQCLRASSKCLFPEPQKRPRRQRVLISSLYERRIEHITQKIDHLVHLMQRLDVLPNQRLPQPSGKNIVLHDAANPLRPTQSSGPDHEGIDMSLLVNALHVANSVETAIHNQVPRQDSRATAEIRLSRQTLQAVLDSQGRHGNSPNEAAPFATSLPPGMTFRDLPVPPIEKVMTCLRMVQDRNITTLPWLGEIKSLGDFTLILVKVCSPGPVTDVELIISLSGLYWMFTACATWALPDTRNDFSNQARLCQSSLEVVLSMLNFWLPTTVDATLAMNLAALFCLQRGKIYACWTFANKAVMLAKALGLHTAASAPGLASEERYRRFCLFWSIYSLERSTALRLARPSAICDQHITIPKPDAYPSVQGLISSRKNLIDGVEMARIHGRAYEDLFSPSALQLPLEHRTTCGQAIAIEWRALIASKEEHIAQWDEDSRGTIGEIMPVAFAQHATRATDYLFLTVIYHVALNHSSTSISADCTAAARISLHEHTTCIALLVSYNSDPALFELWVNGGLILFPFLPFNIIFCSFVETGNLADLEALKALVDALELLSQQPDYTSCAKQLPIFRALYIVAVAHNEVQGGSQLGANPLRSMSDSLVHAELASSASTPTGLSPQIDYGGALNEGLNPQLLPEVPESQSWAESGCMEFDPFGTRLGYWIQESSQGFDCFGET